MDKLSKYIIKNNESLKDFINGNIFRPLSIEEKYHNLILEKINLASLYLNHKNGSVHCFMSFNNIFVFDNPSLSIAYFKEYPTREWESPDNKLSNRRNSLRGKLTIRKISKE